MSFTLDPIEFNLRHTRFRDVRALFDDHAIWVVSRSHWARRTVLILEIPFANIIAYGGHMFDYRSGSFGGLHRYPILLVPTAILGGIFMTEFV